MKDKAGAAMRVFFDFEFIEGGSAFVMEPISIGMVREDGEEYYAEFSGVDWSRANEWVLKNVKPLLQVPSFSSSKDKIAEDIREFVGDSPEFWAYYADYDWVLLCQLYGTMLSLPRGWPKYCLDINQFMWHVDVSKSEIPVQNKGEHLAIADARWNKEVFDYLHNVLRIQRGEGAA